MIRPKILTRLTVPTGGWVLTIKVNNGGAFNETLTATVAAGSYFMARDAQSDDFIWKLETACYTALLTATSADYSGANSSGKLHFWFNSSNQTRVIATNSKDIQIDWTATDGASIAAVLGFSSTAALSLTTANSWNATGTWQHAYGWYATEDGQLESDMADDVDSPIVFQSRAVSGDIKTFYVNSLYGNQIGLSWLTRAQTWSGGGDYTDTPTYPYEKNQGLECWWREAIQGREFRVYRDGGTTQFADTGTATASAATTLTNTNKAYDTDPQRFAGAIVTTELFGTHDLTVRYYISSHTATVLTFANSWLNTALGTEVYFIRDHQYKTYVLDTSKMKSFNPRELGAIDRYGITIPLLRYVA